MRTLTTNLVAILTIGSALLAANSASAGHGFSFGGGKSGGGGKSSGSFKISIGGSSHASKSSHNHHHKFHHNFHHQKYCHYPVKKYYEPVYVVYDQCYHPYYSYCFVYPGDTWYTVAKRCYGHSHLWKHIATYNNLSLSSSALVPGQQLQLPVVNANGTLAASNAPAPASFAPQGASFGPQSAQPGLPGQSIAPQSSAPLANPVAAPSAQSSDSAATAMPAANIRTIADEPTRPVVAIGSSLMLEGNSLGTEQGAVRLRISGMAMPVEVLEWSDSSVKIKLPAMDLTEALKADLEVLRADGSLASRSAIELTPAATRLALGN